MMQISQTAACNRLNSLNQPLGRLLLFNTDWLHTPELSLTQGLTVSSVTRVDIVNRLQGGLHIAMADAALRDHLTGRGSVMPGGTQKQYLDYWKAGFEYPVMNNAVVRDIRLE
jgi:hypothetical protein